MAGHTPGPWALGKGPATGKPCIESADGTWICGQIVNQPGMEAEGEANARLIAAAPDLLEALKSIRAEQRDGYCADETRGLADAAIAKAEGL